MNQFELIGQKMLEFANNLEILRCFNICMETELYTVENRRSRLRVNRQLPVCCEKVSGITLNLSMRGARILSRQPLRRRFLLRLELEQPVEVCAERVWEESVGAGNLVSGVRFLPAPHQQALLSNWMALLGGSGPHSPTGV